MNIRDWKMLQIVVSAPLFLLLLLYFVLPESPRWLIATGRYKEAKELIEKAAKMNKVSNSLRANWGYSLNASNFFVKLCPFCTALFAFAPLFCSPCITEMVNCHWKIQRGQRTHRKSR